MSAKLFDNIDYVKSRLSWNALIFLSVWRYISFLDSTILLILTVSSNFKCHSMLSWIWEHCLDTWTYSVSWVFSCDLTLFSYSLTAFSINVFLFLFDLLYERTKSHLFIVPETETQRRDNRRNGWFSSKNVSGQWSCPFLEMFYCQILKAFNFPLLIIFYILLWELLKKIHALRLSRPKSVYFYVGSIITGDRRSVTTPDSWLR